MRMRRRSHEEMGKLMKRGRDGAAGSCFFSSGFFFSVLKDSWKFHILSTFFHKYFSVNFEEGKVYLERSFRSQDGIHFLGTMIFESTTFFGNRFVLGTFFGNVRDNMTNLNVGGFPKKYPESCRPQKVMWEDEGSEGLMKLHLKIHLEVIYHYIHGVIKKCQDIFFRISYISFLFRIRSFKRGFYSFHVAISKKELLTPLEKKSCFCFVGRAAILVQGWFGGGVSAWLAAT